jgi:hypothetical protein
MHKTIQNLASDTCGSHLCWQVAHRERQSIQQAPEADWLRGARSFKCAELSKTWPPSNVLVTLASSYWINRPLLWRSSKELNCTVIDWHVRWPATVTWDRTPDTYLQEIQEHFLEYVRILFHPNLTVLGIHLSVQVASFLFWCNFKWTTQ